MKDLSIGEENKFPRRPVLNSNYKGIQYYVDDLENYCDLLEETITALRDDYSKQVKVTAELRRRLKEEVEPSPIYCSICKEGVLATYKSTHSSNLYYCDKCSDYVAMEYGISRIERIRRV
jgi:hypothetical protein